MKYSCGGVGDAGDEGIDATWVKGEIGLSFSYLLCHLVVVALAGETQFSVINMHLLAEQLFHNLTPLFCFLCGWTAKCDICRARNICL